MTKKITDTEMMDFIEAAFRERAGGSRVICNRHAHLSLDPKGHKTVRAAIRAAIREVSSER